MGRCAGLALLTVAVVAGACSSDEEPGTATAPVIPTSETPARETTSAPASSGAPVETQRLATLRPGDLPRGRVDEHRINDRRIDQPGSLPPARCP